MVAPVAPSRAPAAAELVWLRTVDLWGPCHSLRPTCALNRSGPPSDEQGEMARRLLKLPTPMPSDTRSALHLGREWGPRGESGHPSPLRSHAHLPAQDDSGPDAGRFQ